MTIVKKWMKDDFDELPSVAVAIGGSKISGDVGRRHLGIYFRAEDSPEKLVHLGWHGKFEIIDFSEEYCWVKIQGVDPVVLDNLADWLPQLWRENGNNISYSIKPFNRNPFETNGKVHFTAPGDGFTCATFVLWAFHRFGIELITLEGWKDRPDDAVWRQWIIDMMRRTRVPAEHIEAQLPYVEHAARFRPEEVAGVAGTYAGVPKKFPEAIELGIVVVNELTELKMI